MKLSEFDKQLRVYETAHDHCVMPGLYIVARLDGRNFSKLTSDLEFAKPFDKRFHTAMMVAITHLMKHCGFNTLYGYTQSDEISILLHKEDQTFSRKLRKLNSVLAGEASARLTLHLGRQCVFDCRVCQLPGEEVVVDYFRWRQEDAVRNALHSHCYWTLLREEKSAEEATAYLEHLSFALKQEFLFQRGVNLNDLPAWQKRGVGLFWRPYTKTTTDRATGEPTSCERRRLEPYPDLPYGETYSSFIANILKGELPPPCGV